MYLLKAKSRNTSNDRSHSSNRSYSGDMSKTQSRDIRKNLENSSKRVIALGRTLRKLPVSLLSTEFIERF